MKLARIKWEKISAIIITPLFAYIIGLHTVRSNFDFESVMAEVLIYGIVGLLFCGSLYSFRKSLLEQ